jgi:signal transduction histidine kinase
LCKDESETPVSAAELTTFAKHAGMAYEGLLGEACQSLGSAVNLVVPQRRKVGPFLDEVLRLLCQELHCEGVTIFLQDETRMQLGARATTGIDWRADLRPEERFYRLGEGLTGKVWQRGRPLLTSDAPSEPGYVGKSWEKRRSDDQSCLIAPVIDGYGNVIAVVRCTGKHLSLSPARVGFFLEKDLSLLDAVGQAMLPHLGVLLAEERRALTLRRLTHELKVPLEVIRGAAEFIEKESQKRRYRFDYPYAEDIVAWHDLMRRLLGNVDFFKFTMEGLRPRPQRIYLLRDVFGPVRHQMLPLLRERGFSLGGITDDGFEAIPHLWLDKSQFMQVFFNLLSNSIKYAYDDPGAFQVQVLTANTGNGFEIRFRDWGPGIPLGYESVIFYENTRGPDAEQSNVAGDGLGLWVVSEAIEAHGGTIEVSSSVNPTEFLIWLPATLTTRWQPSAKG